MTAENLARRNRVGGDDMAPARHGVDQRPGRYERHRKIDVHVGYLKQAAIILARQCAE